VQYFASAELLLIIH